MKILIAEDDTIPALVLRRALEKLGHEVWVEPDGEKAWDLLRGQQFRLVMTDWMMPHLTGVELCRNIREREGRPYVYIILLTANGSKENIVEGLRAEADDYLVKPFHAEELQARILVGLRAMTAQGTLADRVLALETAVSGMGSLELRIPL